MIFRMAGIALRKTPRLALSHSNIYRRLNMRAAVDLKGNTELWSGYEVRQRHHWKQLSDSVMLPS
jgi:hypothetical protein